MGRWTKHPLCQAGFFLSFSGLCAITAPQVGVIAPAWRIRAHFLCIIDRGQLFGAQDGKVTVWPLPRPHALHGKSIHSLLYARRGFSPEIRLARLPVATRLRSSSGSVGARELQRLTLAALEPRGNAARGAIRRGHPARLAMAASISIANTLRVGVPSRAR